MHTITFKCASFLLESTTTRLFQLHPRTSPKISRQLPPIRFIRQPVQRCQYATNPASKSSRKSIKPPPMKSTSPVPIANRAVLTRPRLKAVDVSRPQSFFSQGELDILQRNVPITIFVMNKSTDRRILIVSRVMATIVMAWLVYFLELRTHGTNLPSWELFALGPIVVVCVGMSTFFYWASYRNALRITAVPVAASPTTGASAFVNIVFEGRGFIPFRTRREVIPLRQLQRYRSFAEMQWILDERAAAKAYRERFQPALKDMSPFIRPFIKFGNTFAEYYWAMRAAFLREFYVYIQPMKANFVWRIECRGDFPLGAEFMDRMIPQTLTPGDGWRGWFS